MASSARSGTRRTSVESAAVAHAALAALLALTLPVLAQSHYSPPRTPWGDPDLQGLWPGNMGVPMQRPAAFGDRTQLTDAEFTRREAQATAQAKADAELFVKPGDGGNSIGGPSHWVERGRPTRQASLIIDPHDGRLPPLTAAA